MSVETYAGSCRCGAIHFEAVIAERFRLLDGSGVSEYRWRPPGLEQFAAIPVRYVSGRDDEAPEHPDAI
jgi:hypothetical protein